MPNSCRQYDMRNEPWNRLQPVPAPGQAEACPTFFARAALAFLMLLTIFSRAAWASGTT